MRYCMPCLHQLSLKYLAIEFQIECLFCDDYSECSWCIEIKIGGEMIMYYRGRDLTYTLQI